MYSVNKLYDGVYTFDEGGVRSFLLVGTEKALLIDTGFGQVDFEKELSLITDLPVILVNTHSDGDHTGKNHMFFTRYLSPLELERMKQKLPADNGTYLTIKNGDSFELGGMTLEVIEIPGHTPGSIMLYDTENKRLYSGDSISEDNIFMFGDGRDIPLLIEILKKLKEKNLEVKEVLPNHGECPVYGLSELIADIIQAAENYLTGQKESDIITLNFGTPFKVKRYISGRGKILAEVIRSI